MKHGEIISLAGKWRFRLDQDQLGEHFREQLDAPWQFDARWMDWAHDDSQWEEINVPAHWQVEGYDYNGAAWYRCRFENPLGLGERLWVVFEGVDYFSDVWLNDRYLGSHEGYFASFGYEITPYLKTEQNLLVVRVDSPNDICGKERQVWQLKNQLKGALQRWDMNDTHVNPGGIWNNVYLRKSGPAAIKDIKVHTHIPQFPPLDETNLPVPVSASIQVSLSGSLPSDVGRESTLQIRVAPKNFEGESVTITQTVQLLRESSTWQAPLQLRKARLWYTWDLGFPALYEVEVSLILDGQEIDRAAQTIGFRQIERLEGWETRLNGIRFFQRGANYLSEQLLSTMTFERYQRDLELIVGANLNTIHPFAVVEKHEFYDLCDQYGVLVYQDIPIWLQASNSGDLVRRAVQQVNELISQYGHHPSICIWNFGSQPSVANFTKLASAMACAARELDPCRIIHQANSILDPTGKRYDPLGDFFWKDETIQDFKTRFDWRVDTHQYYGWYYQKDFRELYCLPKEYFQLVTEYGAQALPEEEFLKRIIPKEGLFPPDWRYYTIRNFQPEHQFDYIPQPTSLEKMILDSQRYQAKFIQFHTEYYRKHKFNPCNGMHYFNFNDCWPAISWSVIDYNRKPKLGYQALKMANAPIQVFCEFNEIYNKDDQNIELWLVNDFPHDYKDLLLEWKVKDLENGNILAEGVLPVHAKANSLERLQDLPWKPDASLEYLVELCLTRGSVTLAENRYER